MASQLFHDLFRQATQRDCPLIAVLNDLVKPPRLLFETFKITEIMPTVRGLLELGRGYDSAINAVAVRHGMYRYKFRMQCPYCGSADCPNAVPVRPLPPDIQQYLMDGGSIEDLLDSGK